MYDLQAPGQPVHVHRSEDGGVVIRVPGDIARRGIRVEVLADENSGRDGSPAPMPQSSPVQAPPETAPAAGASALSRVLEESEGLLTNVDRVVFALYFLQAEGRAGLSTRDVAAALKAAGHRDVRRLGLSYGHAASEGLIEWTDDGYRVTPHGSAWVEGWVGPLQAEPFRRAIPATTRPSQSEPRVPSRVRGSGNGVTEQGGATGQRGASERCRAGSDARSLSFEPNKIGPGSVKSADRMGIVLSGRGDGTVFDKRCAESPGLKLLEALRWEPFPDVLRM